MSDSLVDASFDEEKYANDSFETEVPESSFYGSETEFDDFDEQKQQQQQIHKQLPLENASSSKKVKPVMRNGEFMTCESSSDEDDVILGETIAEINNETLDFDEYGNRDDDDDDDADEVSLTPAERIFQMASASRRHHNFPTPPNSKDNVGNDEDIIDDEDYDLSDDEFETLDSEANEAEVNYRKLAKLTASNEFTYEEEQIMFGSGIEIDENYENFSVEDGGEVDVGEPHIGEELGEEEQEHIDDNLSDEEAELANSEKGSISSHSDAEGNEAACGGGDGAAVGAVGAVGAKRYDGGDEKSVRANDSMESFKRRVMLSERMHCQSEGAGDCVQSKGGRELKSSIPVWTGMSRCSQRLASGRNLNSSTTMHVGKPRTSVGSRASLPEFNEKSETECSEKYIDPAAGGDCNESTDGLTDGTSIFEGNSSAYEMEIERFLKAGKTPKPPKKLKAGERRNKSFSNDRLRDIERSNHILLRKIINQKPTIAFSEKKKKNDKFASLPPTTRLSSAEINRKKQERQIALDNQLFKRKLDAILQRKPKLKSK